MVTSVRVPESGVCVHNLRCGMFFYVLSAVLYVRVNCFVVRGYAVSRRYINVCNSDAFSVVYMYIDHLKFCVVCINGRRYVCCSGMKGVGRVCMYLARCGVGGEG